MTVMDIKALMREAKHSVRGQSVPQWGVELAGQTWGLSERHQYQKYELDKEENRFTANNKHNIPLTTRKKQQQTWNVQEMQ